MKLLFVAGWGFTAQVLEPLATRVSEFGEVRCLDMYDLARADCEGSANLNIFAKGLIKLLEDQEEPVFLAGWSLGAMVSMEVAALRPDLVSGLVLMGATPKFCSGSDFKSGQPRKLVRGMRASLRSRFDSTLKRFYRDCFYPEAELNLRYYLRELGDKNRSPELLALGLKYLEKRDLRNNLAHLSCRTLLLHGDADRIVPLAAASALARMLPSSELKVLEGGGHAFAVQDLEWTAQKLIDHTGMR